MSGIATRHIQAAEARTESIPPIENRLSIGYFTSIYPAISHTFIFEEIKALRRQGVVIEHASIHPPDSTEWMGSGEHDELRGTYYMARQTTRHIAGIHLAALAQSPRRYFRMVKSALVCARKEGGGVGKALRYVAGAGMLIAWAKRRGVRHVHVHFGNVAATVALVASHGGGPSFSLTIHGPDIFDDVTSNLLVEKLRAATFVRCISYYCQSQVMRFMSVDAWDRLHIVRCGIDLDQFRPRPDPANPVPHIVCVGRLAPPKGHAILLRACEELRRRGHTFRVTILGNGPLGSTLEEMTRALGLSECVTFVGGLGQEAVRRLLQQTDVVALPSFAEGLPVVLMEAMASEIPCVTSGIMGIPELIYDGVNGMLAPPSDWQTLAGHIEHLLTDAQLRGRLGRAGREAIVKLHDIHNSARLLRALFASEAKTPCSS